MADELSQLLQASWRGVAFPTADLSITFEHGQAEHEVFGKDVSNIEATGRRSRIFSISIPFYNNVVPGQNERDIGASIFPNVFNQFHKAFLDKTSGELIHPRVGQVNVKPRSYHEKIDAQRRDGLVVDVTWIESDDSADGTAPTVDQPAPVTGVVVFAEDLDNLVGNMNPKPEPEPGDPPFTSFSDMASKIRSVFDRVTLTSKMLGGLIDNMRSEVDRLRESIERLNDTSLWPVVDAIENLQSSLFDLKLQGQQTSRKLAIYTTKYPTTLGQISGIVHADLTAMINLNPLLLDEPTIPVGTQVFYYI